MAKKVEHLDTAPPQHAAATEVREQSIVTAEAAGDSSG